MFRPKGTIFVILVIALMIVVTPVRTQEEGQAGRRQWRIVFDSERDGHEEVYIMDPDGSNQQRLTHTPGRVEGSWVPA